MNVQQRLRADKEFFKMQYNSIVIQLNAAVALLHKKCDFAKFTSVFAFKLNSDDKKNKSHISFICCLFQSARCMNTHPEKNSKINDS